MKSEMRRKKLRLSKETIRELDQAALGRVAGGVADSCRIESMPTASRYVVCASWTN